MMRMFNAFVSTLRIVNSVVPLGITNKDNANGVPSNFCEAKSLLALVCV